MYDAPVRAASEAGVPMKQVELLLQELRMCGGFRRDDVENHRRF
jgi:uncharacterized membrane protein